MSTLALPLAILLAPACVEPHRPEIAYELAREALALGEASYQDVPPSAALSILNIGDADLVVTAKDVSGEGSDLLELPLDADFLTLATGTSVSIEVTLSKDASNWTTRNDFTSELILEIGSFWDDPTAWGESPEWDSVDVSVPITFELLCDLDGDGFDADACAGEDCDDEDPLVWPGAPEAPTDVIDYDCDGQTGGTSAEPPP